MSLNKQQLRREIERERRSRVKLRMKELRELIKGARAARREAIEAVRLDCRQKRVELRESCGLRAARARLQGQRQVVERRGELESEQQYERRIRAADRPRQLRSTSGERRQESDDAVRSNLPAELVGVFNAVRRHIKGGPRKSRTEEFLQWAEENPGEVYDLMQHEADRQLAALLAEQARTQKESKRARLAGVPF